MTVDEILDVKVRQAIQPLVEANARLTQELEAAKVELRKCAKQESVESLLDGMRSSLKKDIKDATQMETIRELLGRLESGLKHVDALTGQRYVSKQDFTDSVAALRKEMLQEVENRVVTDGRTLDHAQIRIVPINGIEGGGPIDHTVYLTLSYKHMARQRPAPDSVFAFHDPRDNMFFTATLEEIARGIRGI